MLTFGRQSALSLADFHSLPLSTASALWCSSDMNLDGTVCVKCVSKLTAMAQHQLYQGEVAYQGNCKMSSGIRHGSMVKAWGRHYAQSDTEWHDMKQMGVRFEPVSSCDISRRKKASAVTEQTRPNPA
jgi:hypothetical protein